MNHAKLLHRGMISITGDDALSFLQGIITNDVTHADGDKAVYSWFLTPQGKYLADFFLYPIENGVLLDVDKSVLPDLLKRLTMYKLRSKVTLTDVSDDYNVTAVWNTIEHLHNAYADPRGINFGFRALNMEFEGEQGDYAEWQMINGLPDAADFERERTTMLEANMDLLNAISWTKGCYMGQEITARMRYRGLLKKRYFPIELSSIKEIAADTPITREGKTIGTLRRTYKNHALGVINLDALENGYQCEIDGLQATITLPGWLILP